MIGEEVEIDSHKTEFFSNEEIGRKTYYFVRRVMQDPVLADRIRKRATEIRAEEESAAIVVGCL